MRYSIGIVFILICVAIFLKICSTLDVYQTLDWEYMMQRYALLGHQVDDTGKLGVVVAPGRKVLVVGEPDETVVHPPLIWEPAPSPNNTGEILPDGTLVAIPNNPDGNTTAGSHFVTTESLSLEPNTRYMYKGDYVVPVTMAGGDTWFNVVTPDNGIVHYNSVAASIAKNWYSHSHVFRTRNSTAQVKLRVGVSSFAPGRIAQFRNVRLVKAEAIYNGIESARNPGHFLLLGEGESIVNDVYSFGGRFDYEGTNDHRTLVSIASGMQFNSTRYNMGYPTGFPLVYKFDLKPIDKNNPNNNPAPVKFQDAKLKVNVGSYTRGACVVQALLPDGVTWEQIGKDITSVSLTTIDIPAKFFVGGGADAVYVRFGSSSDSGYQLYGMLFEATLPPDCGYEGNGRTVYAESQRQTTNPDELEHLFLDSQKTLHVVVKSTDNIRNVATFPLSSPLQPPETKMRVLVSGRRLAYSIPFIAFIDARPGYFIDENLWWVEPEWKISPTLPQPKPDTAKPIRIDCPKNGYESFQIIVNGDETGINSLSLSLDNGLEALKPAVVSIEAPVNFAWASMAGSQRVWLRWNKVDDAVAYEIDRRYRPWNYEKPTTDPEHNPDKGSFGSWTSWVLVPPDPAYPQYGTNVDNFRSFGYSGTAWQRRNIHHRVRAVFADGLFSDWSDTIEVYQPVHQSTFPDTWADNQVQPTTHYEKIVDIRYAYYHRVTQASASNIDRGGMVGETPDALPPLDTPLQVKPNRNQPLWVTVRIPDNTEAGEYNGVLTLDRDGTTQQIPFTINVWNFMLPKRNKHHTAFNLSDRSELNWYHNADDNEDQRKVYEMYLQIFSDYRISPRVWGNASAIGGGTTLYNIGWNRNTTLNPELTIDPTTGKRSTRQDAWIRETKRIENKFNFTDFNFFNANFVGPKASWSLLLSMCFPIRRSSESPSNWESAKYTWKGICADPVWQEKGIVYDEVTPNGPVVSWFDRSDVPDGEKVFALTNHPFYVNKMSSYLEQFQDMMRVNGWLDRVTLYWFDEPELEGYPYFAQQNALIEKSAPELARFVTREPNRWFIDVLEQEGTSVNRWCLNTRNAYDDIIKPRQEKGEDIWWYFTGYPYAGMDRPDGTAMRVLFWQVYQRGILGTLYWATLVWTNFQGEGIDPYEVPMTQYNASYYCNGGARLIYPPLSAATPGGQSAPLVLDAPVPSMRLVATRAGLQDIEMLYLLEDKKAERPDLAEQIDALLEVPADITSSLTEWTFDPAPIVEHRRKIAAMLEQ